MIPATRLSRWLAGGALGLTFLVVVLGAYTRLVGAGLGCPDWPGCYGSLIVPSGEQQVTEAELAFPDAPFDATKAWVEMVHRYFAALLGLVILCLAVVAWRTKQNMRLPIALAVLVIVQGAFGAWTVTMKLWPQIVTLHLLGGFTTLVLLWVFAVEIGLIPRWVVVAKVRRHASWVCALLVLQIALGGWVSANYAALACPDFPLCHGELIPDMDLAKGFNIFQAVGPNYLGGALSNEARIAIQVMHRLGAFVILFATGWLMFRLRGWAHGCIGAALVIQFGLGISNVVFNLPLAVATAHNLFAALLLLCIVHVLLGTSNSDSLHSTPR